jgi:hypothetical protein
MDLSKAINAIYSNLLEQETKADRQIAPGAPSEQGWKKEARLWGADERREAVEHPLSR